MCAAEIFRGVCKIVKKAAVSFVITVNDDKKDTTVLAYLFIPNRLYMFRAMSSLNHQEHLTVFTASDIVHRYCC